MTKKIATLKQRLVQFLEYKGISKSNFYKKTGLKRGILDNDKLHTGLNDKSIAIIIANFPEINPIWLLTGEGEMLKKGPEMHSENAQKMELAQKEIELLKKQIEILQHETEIRKEEVQMLREMKDMQEKMIAEIKKQLERCQGVKKDMPKDATDI